MADANEGVLGATREADFRGVDAKKRLEKLSAVFMPTVSLSWTTCAGVPCP
jgi:hypothetical protein